MFAKKVEDSREGTKKKLEKKNYVLKENLEHFTFSVGFTTFNVGIRDCPGNFVNISSFHPRILLSYAAS